MGTGADGKTLMLVLLDSNIYFSALISLHGAPARISQCRREPTLGAMILRRRWGIHFCELEVRVFSLFV
jgi:hypothetical protein